MVRVRVIGVFNTTMHRQKSGEEELIDAYLEFSEEERHGGLLVIGGQLVILVFV